jgi:DNA polymerase-3 subunit beta
MKLKLEKQELVAALSINCKFVDNRGINPILSYVLIEAENEKIRVISSDSIVSCATELKNSTCRNNGRALIKGNFFLNLVKKITSKYIEIELIENNKLIIENSEKTYYSEITTIEDNYPEISFVEDNKTSISISKEIFLMISTKLSQASLRDSQNLSIFNAVNFSVSDGKMRILSTDSYRLITDVFSTVGDSMNVNIEAKLIDTLSTFMSDKTKDVQILTNSRFATIKIENVIVQTKLIDGNFPDVNKLLNIDSKNDINVSCEDFKSAIERGVALLPSERNPICTLSFDQENLMINFKNMGLASSNESVKVEFTKKEDPKFKVSLNANYLLSVLESCLDKVVILSTSGDLKPVFIKQKQRKDFNAIIVPVRV